MVAAAPQVSSLAALLGMLPTMLACDMIEGFALHAASPIPARACDKAKGSQMK